MRLSKGEKEFFHLVGGHAFCLGEFGVRETGPHACGHEAQPCAVEGCLGCRELGDHRLAIGTLVQKSLHTAHLPLGPAKSIEYIV